MPVSIAASRANPKQQARIFDLLHILPQGTSVLEIGARDCYITRLLVDRFDQVTALDLSMPVISHQRVRPIQGDVTALDFPDRSFDVVVCTEVLEHIAPELLQNACNELARVADKYVVIGVPFEQDIRVCRSRCSHCGKRNPPFGHRNSFSEAKLRQLFAGLRTERVSFTGETRERTNFLSAMLLDLAGNPYGTYHQQEGCVHCGKTLQRPGSRSLSSKLAGKVALSIERIQRSLARPRPIWVHILFRKPEAGIAVTQ